MMTKKSNLSLARRAAVALSVVAMALLCVPTTAHAQDSDDDDRVSQAHHADVSSLKGKDLEYKTYKSYISTGRPNDNSKKFLLYNVGTKKFLNVGSYWGTHAALSEVPRPFWLQRRNEVKTSGQWSYLRYPESANDNAGYFYNDFFNLTKVQVGNIEGSKRAHATYIYVRKVRLDGTDSTDIMTPNTPCDGATIFKDDIAIDFNKEKIVARIDMSKCTATSSGGGNMETLLSVGQNVQYWDKDGVKYNNLHIYGFKSGGLCQLRVQPLDAHYSDATYKSGGSENPITVTDGIVNIEIKQQSIMVNGVQCMPRNHAAYESAITPLLAQTSLSIGSAQGKVLTTSTYNWVKLTNASVYDNDPTHVLAPDVEMNGRTFYKSYEGNLADRVIAVELDLTTCKNADENVLSIGTDIANWGTTGGNIHVYYTASSGVLQFDAVNSTFTGSQKRITKTIAEADRKSVKITLDRDGLYLNGTLLQSGSNAYDDSNDIVAYLLNTATSIQVGSEQGTSRSYATYKSATVKTVKTTTDNVVEPGYKCEGVKIEHKTYGGNLADKAIEAVLDLTTCATGVSENILSIGADIAKWGDTNDTGNIHIYYTATSDTEGTLQFEAVNSTYKGNQKQIKTTLTGDAIKSVKITLSKAGIYLNGTLLQSGSNIYNTVGNPIVYNLVNTATGIQVGSEEGTGRSHATYTSLVVKAYATDDASEASAQSATRSASKTQTIYENLTGTRSAFGADKAYEVSFADGDKIEASINIDNATAMENVISIGTNIDQWGSGSTSKMHNLHIYYLKNDTHNNADAKLLQVVYVNKDHSDDTKRAIYIDKDADGHYTMTLSLSKDGLIINGTNVYPAIDPTPLLPYSKYADHAGDIVRVKQDSYGNHYLDEDGHYIIADDDDMTAHGIYVSNNGYIYTSESRSNETMPLFITSRYAQESTASGNEGSYLAWAPYLENNDKWGTTGVFADRQLPSAELTTAKNIECAQWVFEKTEAADATEKGEYLYKIRLKMKDVQRHKRNDDGSVELETVSGSKNFYLQACEDYVYGNGMEKYDGNPEMTDVTLVEARETPAEKPDYDVWKLIDLNEYNTAFDWQESEMTSMLDLTYNIYDADFARQSSELPHWTTAEGNLDGSLRVGYDHFSKKKLADTDYTDENGKNADKDSQGNWKDEPSEQFKTVRQRTNNHGRYMGVDVRGDGNGKFCQEVTVGNAGWYAVSCGGMTTVGAKLFVQMKKADGSYTVPIYQSLHALTDGELKFLNATDHKWPFDQVDGTHPMPMYNALVAINDRNITGKTIDDDGTLKAVENSTAVLADKYTSQVAFFVDPTVLKDSLTLRLGVEIPSKSADGTETTADGSVSGRWTVFDNFHLMFGGKSTEPNLILDEDSTNLDYIERSAHVFEMRPMRLHRTFKGNQWNTLILPVNLTKSDFQELFGETATLAELKSLTKNTIEFASVKVDKESDLMFHAFKPYIIKVDDKHETGKGEGGKEQPYSALLARRDDTQKFDTVSIKGEHFYLKSANLAGKHLDTGTAQYHYSFAADTKGEQQTIKFDEGLVTASTAYTAGKMLYTYRDNTLAERTDPTETDGSLNISNLRAYGTLCKNYVYDTAQGKNVIPDGYPTLKNGYVMQSNNLYKIRNQYGTKGFRCWFASDNDATGQLSPSTKVSIDGIVDGTTGIADIYGDTGAPVVARFADGVYTIDGRKVRGGTSLDGLPAGVYIVNGSKTVVSR